MGESKRRVMHETAHELSSAAADKGRLLELGFRVFVAIAKPPIPVKDLPQWRDCYFAGAQHLFSGVFEVLDGGQEASDRDMRRMDLIAHELEAWSADINARMGNPFRETQKMDG